MRVGRNAISPLREINHADRARSKNDLLYHGQAEALQGKIF
jgi:hypothetical protein